MNKKVLIVGNGGREYAIGAHLRKSENLELFFAPGNAGTKMLGVNLSITNNQDILRFCIESKIDWVIIGPEVPLVEGLSDVLREDGIKVFGPSKSAAKLEGSKAFMKDFLARYNIPTARYIQTTSQDEAIAFALKLPLPVVIKASGLCAGKGVIIAQSYDEAKQTICDMLSGKSFGDSGKCVIIEEFLDGYELSVFGICDGEHFKLLPACQDHKRLLSNDKGPNTGGMGAYAPTPLCDENLTQKIADKIFVPTLKGMSQENSPFSGVLFAGIMVVKQENGELEPILLEFNVRFGDPECEVLMPLLETPLLEICEAVESKSIDKLDIRFSNKHCVGVVLASHNYPYGSSKAYPITITDFPSELGEVCFAGVSEGENQEMLASGGRVALAIGKADTLKQARDNAYKITDHIHFQGRIYRDDIANKAFKALQ